MTPTNTCRIGIDIGSTTLKIVVLNPANDIIYKTYRRHKAHTNALLIEELSTIARQFPDAAFSTGITGSVGMGIAERVGIPFIQEVVASIEVIKRLHPDTRTMIDLGGEDAKMVFFDPNRQPDIRMNGSCAGGTGAFIDQMADLMNVPVEELGRQALQYETIYPIASRCGVFAKTDVQNLLSRNIPVADVSISILQAVALQCITALARGCSVQPKIICTGGPFTFLPALRNVFGNVLGLHTEALVLPENSEFFPAWGTALHQPEEQPAQDIRMLIAGLRTTVAQPCKDTLPPLFRDETDYRDWKRHRKVKPLKIKPENNIESACGESLNCFLGIDSGSTTTKMLIMDEEASVVYQYYAGNEGNPLKKIVEGLHHFYAEMQEKGVSFRFLSSAATGYGEDLIKSALNLDYGIVETMAHLFGAQYVDPDVSFILDIGGQDMKSIFIQERLISNIELNEACSSGCGSFLQNFAATMNLSLPEFTRAACLSKHPSDLGTRCTVFMNSKVKQSLRENVGLEDIAAGLAYSVVKNCLFKVLKIVNLNQLGEHIVVQGGAFRNDAVYRALELLSGKSVSSTDHPELMGALGAALYAQRTWEAQGKPATGFTGREALPDVHAIPSKELQCKGCSNQCSVLRFQFANGNNCYAGNKCEKVFCNKNTAAPQKGFNAFDWKNEVLFGKDTAENKERKQLLPSPLPSQTVGIPRVLNMFENHPFWHTLFTGCGFQVSLSPESTFSLYQKGVGSVMSDNICFPAKLVHGHILSLVAQGVDRIFYPMVIKEEKEREHTSNSYNCPVVSGYPDVVRSSMEPEEQYGIAFDKPVISFHDIKILQQGCLNYFSSLGVPKKVFRAAFKQAVEAWKNTAIRLQKEQKALLDRCIQSGELVFIVAGRPYHTDPLVHRKVGQILSDLGAQVLTDDVFRSAESDEFARLNIVSQWSYPNRVVQAAMAVANLPQNVQLIQLNSFGCGPDSFFMTEVGEVLKQAGKNHTVLRIDEIVAPGSIRLRLRSLIESLKANGEKMNNPGVHIYKGYGRGYTSQDRQKTILTPWFTDFLSPFIPAIGALAGYRVVNLPKTTKASVDAGLKYGHNEVCYPLTLILGDIINALQSGKYDLKDIVVSITQTGGQCRATNYLSQIKMGLQHAGFSDIPVVAIATGKVYQNEQEAFKFPFLKIADILVYTLLYADALQQMYHSTAVKEKTAGKTQEVFDFYMQCGVEAVSRNNSRQLLKLLEQAVADFNTIPVYDKTFTKVGLVGEIYVKYNNYGQAYMSDWLRSNGVEVVMPPVLDFFMQYFVNAQVNIENGLEKNRLMQRFLSPLCWAYMNVRIRATERVMQAYRFYRPSESIYTKAQYASEILDLSNQFGEGWSIAAEVAVYARNGINRVVCMQPFGCIANHIVAKGIEKRLKKYYPDMNLIYLDMDGGMAEVNLQNRLHFLID
ncbi:MAG: acyl-CoA dehydratase activase-related protein [Dysgonamonadaceae bacterium]|jgi:predicted CoA-substrate-specific enzyme activase|nr:acyl-CoA dehydratase activase-related protein [Dysgonamonadaceae bacterium]